MSQVIHYVSPPLERDAATLPADEVRPATRTYLFIECLLLFAVMPLVVAMAVEEKLPIFGRPLTVLLILILFVMIYLGRDVRFRVKSMFRPKALRRALPGVLATWLAGGLVLFAIVAAVEPEILFWLPRNRIDIWLMVMCLYPIFSAMPQEIVWRAFFFHRYRHVFDTPEKMIAANAVAFGFMHVVVGGWIAIGLCLLGGVIFAWRYYQTRSLLVVSIEHALWGQLAFTLGLGKYLYHGSRDVIREVENQAVATLPQATESLAALSAQ